MNILETHLAELQALYEGIDSPTSKESTAEGRKVAKATIEARIDHTKSCLEYERGEGAIRWTGFK